MLKLIFEKLKAYWHMHICCMEPEYDEPAIGLPKSTEERFIMVYRIGCERYVWAWKAGNIQQAYNSVTAQAADESLSLNWHDAAVITQRMRAMQFETFVGADNE